MLEIKTVSHTAAKYACEHWHYSKCMPAGKCIKYGVFEDSKFRGVVIFSRGANNNLLKPYGLKTTEGCELSRVALSNHKNTVTKIISICFKLIKKSNPDIRVVISFADTAQGHEGKIYQAGNWLYLGSVKSTPDYFYKNKWRHQRSINSLLGSLKRLPPETKKREGSLKHRYLYLLDKSLLSSISKFIKKRGSSSMVECQAFQSEDNGSSPIDPLKFPSIKEEYAKTA